MSSSVSAIDRQSALPINPPQPNTLPEVSNSPVHVPDETAALKKQLEEKESLLQTQNTSLQTLQTTVNEKISEAEKLKAALDEKDKIINQKDKIIAKQNQTILDDEEELKASKLAVIELQKLKAQSKSTTPPVQATTSSQSSTSFMQLAKDGLEQIIEISKNALIAGAKAVGNKCKKYQKLLEAVTNLIGVGLTFVSNHPIRIALGVASTNAFIGWYGSFF